MQRELGDGDRIAKIERAFLGWEDHGILTVGLTLNYGGSGQVVGNYALDRPGSDGRRRAGTEYGCDWIMRTMEACGANEWAQVEGRTIVARFDDLERCLEIRPLPTEEGRPFVFEELRAAHRGKTLDG